MECPREEPPTQWLSLFLAIVSALMTMTLGQLDQNNVLIFGIKLRDGAQSGSEHDASNVKHASSNDGRGQHGEQSSSASGVAQPGLRNLPSRRMYSEDIHEEMAQNSTCAKCGMSRCTKRSFRTTPRSACVPRATN